MALKIGIVWQRGQSYISNHKNLLLICQVKTKSLIFFEKLLENKLNWHDESHEH
jgi:hypothetical protein